MIGRMRLVGIAVVALGACAPRVAPVPTEVSGVATVVAAPGEVAKPSPFVVGQDWSGHYTCPTRETLIIFHVEKVEASNLEGAVIFRDPATGTSGSYDVAGTFDATGHLTLRAGAWIEPARGHRPEDVIGVLKGREIIGYVGMATCQLALELGDSVVSTTPDLE
jgi:hypothetical protein